MVVQECAVWFPPACKFSNFPLAVDFYFHIHCGQKRYWYDFSLLEFVKIRFVASYVLSWKMFCVHLRRMCILILLDRMVSIVGPELCRSIYTWIFLNTYASLFMICGWLNLWMQNLGLWRANPESWAYMDFGYPQWTLEQMPNRYQGMSFRSIWSKV